MCRAGAAVLEASEAAAGAAAEPAPLSRSMAAKKRKAGSGGAAVPAAPLEEEARATLAGHTQCVAAVAWPMPGTLFSGSWDHSVRASGWRPGRPVRSARGRSMSMRAEVVGVFSGPQGHVCASCTETCHTWSWDQATAAQLWKMDESICHGKSVMLFKHQGPSETKSGECSSME